MKIDTSDVKRGTVLLMDGGNLYRVKDIGHTHMGRWGATYTFKCANILTWANNTYTYKSGTTLESADVSKMNGVFLYDAVDTYSFMENDTGEIHDLDISVIEWEVSYLKENLEVFLVKYDDAIIGIELSPVINYVVTETLPWDKWNRVSAGTKDATLENGMEVQVPMHTKQWDSVSLNTTTGKVS